MATQACDMRARGHVLGQPVGLGAELVSYIAIPFAAMGNVLTKAAVLDFSIQWSTFLIASYLRTERFFDATGSVTFIILLLQSLMHTRKFFPRQVIQSGLVSTWAARLGMFLVTRILRDGRDSRFNHVRDNPKRFFFYWTVQGACMCVVRRCCCFLHGFRLEED